VLPRAFIHPLSSSSLQCRDETVRAAIIRTQRLHKAFSGCSKSINLQKIPIFAERWGVHIPGTQWMFSYGHSTTSIVIQCTNLIDGSVTGETPVAGQLHSSKTISGQIHKHDQTLLAVLYEETRDDKGRVLPHRANVYIYNHRTQGMERIIDHSFIWHFR